MTSNRGRPAAARPQPVWFPLCFVHGPEKPSVKALTAGWTNGGGARCSRMGSLQNSGEGGTADEATMSRGSLLDGRGAPVREAARRSTKIGVPGQLAAL